MTPSSPQQLRDDFYEKFGRQLTFGDEGLSSLALNIADYWLKVVESERRGAIGNIGAKLLARHSPQAVLDAYFEAANEELEGLTQENGTNN